MKLRIVQKREVRAQCKPDFMNKIEAKDLICPSTPPLDLLMFISGGREQTHGGGCGRSRRRGHLRINCSILLSS